MTNNWVQWFIGFIDAEGNFQTTIKPRKNKYGVVTSYGVGYSFHLGLSMTDNALVRNIQNMLGGIGTLHEYPNKGVTGECHYAITRRSDLEWFLNTVFANHHLLTSYQAMRLSLVIHGMSTGIKSIASVEAYNEFRTSIPQQLVDLSSVNIAFFSNWLVGFINGEGHFAKNGGFVLEHTDLAVLQHATIVLGLSRDVIHNAVRPNRKPTYTLAITFHTDIKKLVYFLENCSAALQGNKLFQYKAWKLANAYLRSTK